MIKKIKNYFLDTLYLKTKDDIILAAYPKTGSTWVRFLFCNLISLKKWDGKTVDFDLLNNVMPSFGQGELKNEWTYETIPRIVKTHKKYFWPLFNNKKTILMLRDPRDVMISRFFYEKARKNKPYRGTLLQFMKESQFGLKNFFEHYYSWNSHTDVFIKYEDLKKDTFQEFSKVLNKLEIEIKDELIKKSINRSDINNVRSIEEKNGHTRREKNFEDDFKFTRNGSINQWKHEFSKKETKYYEKVKNKYDFKLY